MTQSISLVLSRALDELIDEGKFSRVHQKHFSDSVSQGIEDIVWINFS